MAKKVQKKLVLKTSVARFIQTPTTNYVLLESGSGTVLTETGNKIIKE